MVRKPRPRWTTRPRIPRSAARVFVPPPTTDTGKPSADASRRTRTSSSGFDGSANHSAGPPMRKLVWLASDSCRRTQPVGHVIAEFSDVARAQEEGGVAGAGDVGDE